MEAPRALALCHCFTGALDFQTGNWDEAEKALREAIRLYREVGSASGESLSLQRLGVLLTARDRHDEARDALNDGLVVAERAAMRAHCLTRLHASMTRNRLAANDLASAKASLAEGLEAARRHGHCVTCNALLLPEAVRVTIEAGDLEAAQEYATELEEISKEFESTAWTAMASHARGRVLLAHRRLEEADVALERARNAFVSIEQEYEAARCDVDLAASAAARSGAEQAKRAEEIAARAQRVFVSYGSSGEVTSTV